jgi:hypothetical protein
MVKLGNVRQTAKRLNPLAIVDAKFMPSPALLLGAASGCAFDNEQG